MSTSNVLLFGLAGLAGYIALNYMSNAAYSKAAATCNAQCPVGTTYWDPADAPVVASGNPSGLAAPTLCQCAAYTQWNNSWGWFQPYAIHISL
jgi:hypothetical protein